MQAKTKLPIIIELAPCPGEAHQNAFIDHCGVCLPYTWGKVPKFGGDLPKDKHGRKLRRVTRDMREARLILFLLRNTTLTQEARATILDSVVDHYKPDEYHRMDCKCGECAPY